MKWLSGLKTFALLVSATFVCPAPAISAGELDPAHVPADATWLVHVDYEALSDSQILETFRERNTVVTRMVQGWMQERFGIDPPRDLASITMYSRDFKEHTGTSIIQADYDASKIEASLRKAEQYEATNWNGHTLHTVTLAKQAQTHDHKHNGQPGSYQMTVVMVDDNTLLLGSSVENAKQTLKLLAGDSKSLKEADSPLLIDQATDGWMYAAAIHLAKLEEQGPAMPVLAQHERVTFVLGKKADGKLYERAKFVAQSEDVAEKMTRVMDGIIAYERLWSKGSAPMKQLLRNVKVQQEGTAVTFHWEGETEQVVNALDDLFDRMSTWKPVALEDGATMSAKQTGGR